MAQIPTANAALAIPLSQGHFVETTSTDSAKPSQIALLTRRLAAGDEEAFRQFHEQYFDRLYRFLLLVNRGDEQQTQEALQETLLRLLRYARPFDNEEIFWSWLKAVARSAARDLGRKNRRYFALLRVFALGAQAKSGVEDNSESRLGAILEETLGELDAADCQLVKNKYLDGHTVKDLSAFSGDTEKAVESRLLRLRRRLRERILEKLKEP
jgi:RNA polymerase sigma-70 factor, ECF subfamily